MMKSEVKDGETMLVFDDCEEMKWYYHKKMCQGKISQNTAMFLIERCLEVDKANEFLERFGEPCRVRKPEELET